jgi:S-DNA-T family DNA segregation ATPase FtsK/SpoIIIE
MAEAARSSATTGERIELRLTVIADSADADLVIDAAESDDLAAFSVAAGPLVGNSAAGVFWCERRGETLDPATTLGDSGIRWGDRLLLARHAGEPTRVGGSPAAELVITGGPCSGQRWELGIGSYSVGRDGGCDICLLDPSVSRHHLDLEVTTDAILASDAGSSNTTAIDGRALAPGSWRPVLPHDELELGRSLARLRHLGSLAQPGIVQRRGRLDFNRPPRVNQQAEPFTLKLAAPPSRARKARLPLAASLLPIGAGVLLFVLLKSPVMLAIAGLSPLMAISSFLSDRRGGTKSYARGSAAFRKALAGAVSDLDVALVSEAQERRRESPDASTLIARTRDLAASLWERRSGDADFLVLRIGVADLPARARVELAEGGEEELREAAEQELGTRRTVAAVPLTIDLPKLGIVGLVGARPASVGLARWLILQAAILHSPGDLVIAAALGPDTRADFDWLKWLPHLRLDRINVEAAAVALDPPAAQELMREVGALVAGRVAQRRATKSTSTRHCLTLPRATSPRSGSAATPVTFLARPGRSSKPGRRRPA